MTEFKADVLPWAIRYIKEGQLPVPIPLGKKGPILKGWQNLRLTAETAPQYFNGEPSNIGNILGVNGLIDIDLDCPEARALAKEFLPSTGCIFGRKGSPRSHWIYVASPAPKTQQWAEPYDKTLHTDNDKLMLVELRSTGAQTVFPPSVHPSGEPIRFDEDGEPAVVEGAVLTREVSRLAAACLLVRYWPSKGVRHTWALALAGGLLRGGWREEEATRFMHAVVTVAMSEDTDLHVAAVRDTAKKLAADEQDPHVTGWPKLSELLGARVVKAVRAWCVGEEAAPNGNSDVMRELNAIHAVVMIGGKCAVLTETKKKHETTITFSRAADFKMRYMNRSISVGKHQMDIATYWLKHPTRRQYRTVVFAPEGCAPDEYNLWRGFAVEEREGDCSKFLAHLEENIAAGNTAHYQWLLAWMASLVQHPAALPGTSVVMRGKEGTGKGVMAHGFGGLFGQHYIPLTQKRHLVGNFNAHLRETTLVFVDEAFWAHDRQAEGVLKGLISEKEHMIEQKGYDPIKVANYTHYIISSNHDWVVPAGRSARRWFVLDVGDKHIQDAAYFSAIEMQMKNGGSEALLYYLKHYAIGDVDLRNPPKTDAMREQKDHSMTPVQRFWKNCLMRGSNSGKEWHEWKTSVECELLHEWYCEEAGILGVRHRADETELGTQLKKLVPGLRKVRRWVTMMVMNYERKYRRYTWEFPDLDTCRRGFDTVMNCEYDWTVEEDPTIPT